MARPRQGASYTIVIKLGTSSIVHEVTHQPLLSTLTRVVEVVVQLRKEGHKVVIVTSGAIGVGLLRMSMPLKPKSLSGKQALAAIGQGRLIALWDSLFTQFSQPIAQILLTRGDISDRTRYLNAVNAFKELLSLGVVPIVNENDTISVSEIKFGDNDTLSAITSSMLQADYLFLLTDVDGLYTSNPRKDPSAKSIEIVQSVAEVRNQVSTTTLGSSLGTGGMETKLIAAEIATAAGVTTVITSSKHPENISSIIDYNAWATNNIILELGRSVKKKRSKTKLSDAPERPPHTVFLPSQSPLRDLKSWTSHTLHPAGTVIIDNGAHCVLSRRESGGRLLPAGVLGVKGAFASGQAVRIFTPRLQDGVSAEDTDAAKASYASGLSTPPSWITAPSDSAESFSPSAEAASRVADLVINACKDFEQDELIEVGRGLANYNSDQIARVKGLNSSYIPQLLGYADSEYVVENITIRVPP